jgi:hypothetical protein
VGRQLLVEIRSRKYIGLFKLSRQKRRNVHTGYGDACLHNVIQRVSLACVFLPTIVVQILLKRFVEIIISLLMCPLLGTGLPYYTQGERAITYYAGSVRIGGC